MCKLKMTFGCLLLLSLLAIACRKPDEYKKYVAGGEIQYIAKADSLKFMPGYERGQLYWLLISDPRITKTKVYWNNRADSVMLDINRGSGIDTFRISVDSLEEGTYEFEVQNFDNQGHYSVPARISGNVYGQKYETGLSNRRVSQAFKMQKGPADFDAMIIWRGVSIYDNIVSLEVRYINAFNEPKTILTDGGPAVGTTTLPDYVPGTSFSYRTGYKPDSLAIDTFYASPQSFTIH